MVKAGETFTAAEPWKEVFNRGRVLPPSRLTSRLAAENHLSESRGFELSLSRVKAPHLPQEAPQGSDVSYQLRASLFDGRQQQFFGQTWKSRLQLLRNGKISFNQVLYFHTVLRLPRVFLVVELVEVTVKADSSQQAMGRGFTLLELFSPSVAPAFDGNHRLNLHHGSPRGLLHPALKDITDYSCVLRAIEESHVDCSLKSHSALASAQHLFPENVLLSGDENIPGLQPSPTGGALLKPRLLPSVAFTLSSVTVSLWPSVESFETQLLQRVNTDRSHTKQLEAKDPLQTMVIQERRLHVGAHNGWGFLESPQVVVLEVLPPAGAKDKTSSPQKLGLRSSLQLTLIQHPAVAIVFQLEYVFSAPIGRESLLSATAISRAAFLQSLRWGVCSPFHPSSDPREGDVRLALQGGAASNPHHVMMYQAGSEEVSGQQDTISFHLSSSVDRQTSSSKRSVKAQEKILLSPAAGHRPQSPPDSPQGPELSLSQLAGTTRYPTITHFRAASPWQPSSLLHPSPLATAHQLPQATAPETDLTPASLPAPDDGPLEELAFTPVHAPVLRLGASALGSRTISSRRSLARLSSAGFPEVLDYKGQPAVELDPSQLTTFDPQREDNDPLQGNLVLLQFLAFTRVPGEGVAPDWPRSVYFTFHFYRFPPVNSQPLVLLTDQSQSGTDGLCLLSTTNWDGTTSSEEPGLQLQFRLDHSFLRPGERSTFMRYLALHSLHIDVWDSDSLLLLGSTALTLQHLLRQGKAAVQSLHELDVLITDYNEEEPTSGTQGLECSLTTVLRGRLHVRSANIGCPYHSDQQRAVDPAPSHIILPQELYGGFRGGSLSPRSILQPNARSGVQAQRLKIDRSIRAEPSQDVRRKLSCMAAVRQREGSEQHTLRTTANTDVWRGSDAAVKWTKAEAITHMLKEAMTQNHLLFSAMGSAQYLEYVLKNPFNSAHTVTIISEHPDLSVITDAAEWRHFKSLAASSSAVEENMFHLEPEAPGPRVYLRPKESLHIPLKYQTFQSDGSSMPQGPSLLPAGVSPGSTRRNAPHSAAPNAIKVTFTKEDGKPLSILQVNIQLTPHVVDQTFRLYQPEQSFLKKAIRLPPWIQATGTKSDPPEVTVRCTDPDVICHIRSTLAGEPQDVYLKVPGGPSSHVRDFSVMVFTDPWAAAPAQVWQVYVHFLERVDLIAVSGQRSCQSLLLRGKHSMRKLRCYCSHPQDVQIDPGGVFVLPPATVQEVQVKVQPWRTGRRFLHLNAVDVEQQRVVSSWFLCLTAHRPVISKAFEVSVPVGEGRGSSRKISYTNPYSRSRSLLLRSDQPQLLQFREEQFQVGGGETYTIGLRFAPSTRPGAAEIFVYVNNQEEKTEEAFCVKVTYS